MLEDALLELTSRCDIVIDPFLGLRLDLDRRRQDRPRVLRRRAGAALCRYDPPALRGRDGNPAVLIETGAALRATGAAQGK
jgi:hypothetical protein